MTCERVSDWPPTMVAAGPKTSRVASEADVRPVRSITSRSVMALGSWNVGRRCMILTWGLSPRCRGGASPAVLAAHGLPLLSSFSPIPATHHLYRVVFRGLPARTTSYHTL